MTRTHSTPYRNHGWLSPEQIRARFDKIRDIVRATGRPPNPVQTEFNFSGKGTLPSRRSAIKRRPRVLIW